MIERINASGKPVVAVDVPSGVDASTGEVPGAAVRATVTVTFAAAKVGLAIAPGRLHAGSVHVASIGLARRRARARARPGDRARARCRASRARARSTAPGSVLVVGGSRGLTGAPMLAALAAFRADAGYVGVAAPESTLPVIESRAARGGQVAAAGGLGRPRARARGRRGARGRRARRRGRDRARASAAATARASSSASCSSGSSCRSWSTPTRSGSSSRSPAPRRPCSRRTAASSRACSTRPRPRSTRTGCTRCAARRPSTARSSCSRARTRSSRRRARACSSRGYGQPSLATAGTGDVLTGIVAAFLAKGLEPRLAAAAAAVAHGLASRLAEPQVGTRRERPAARPSSARLPATAGSGRRSGLVARSEITIDLGGAAAQRRAGCSTRSAARSSGRSSRRTRYGHGARRLRTCGARSRCDGALRRDRRRSARAAARATRGAIVVMGPATDARSPTRARGAPRALRQRRRARRHPGARQARHRDGALGPVRAADRRRGTSSALPTHLATADTDLDFARIQVERFREATAGVRAPHPPRREQRRRAAAARGALRRGPLRDRALRPLAVRHVRRRGRARARALAGRASSRS